MPPVIQNGGGRLPQVSLPADEVAGEADVRWRPSRHARRLLTLAAAGLLAALLTRRPELAGLAGPAVLLLGAGRAARPSRLEVRTGLTATRLYEGELGAADVSVTAGDADYDARWTLEPGRGIEPGSATAVNGAAARFTFAMPRWGKRGSARSP